MKSEITDNGKHLYTLYPGEYFATSEDCIVSTVTGACVVVCLYDGIKSIIGMGHFIVPGIIGTEGLAYDEITSKGIGDMEFLMGEVVKLGGDRRNLTAEIYGAGNFITGSTSAREISDSNIRFLHEYFKMENIKILNEDLGGDVRRKIDLYTCDGSSLCRYIEKRSEYSEFSMLEKEYIATALKNRNKFGEVFFFDSETYETLINLIPDIIYRINKDGEFNYISDSIIRLGYEPKELVGKHFSEIVHPEDLNNIQRASVLPGLKGKKTEEECTPRLFDERRTGRRITKNLRVRLLPKEEFRTGEKYPVGEVISTGHYTVTGDEHNFSGSIGLIRDITDVVSVQRALFQTEKYYRYLMDNSSDVFSILALDGTILYKSNSVLRVTGYNPFELAGENEYDVTHEEDHGLLKNIVFDPGNAMQPRDYIEHRFLHKDKYWIILESSVFKIIDEEKNMILVALYSRDVTKRKMAENSLKAALHEKEVLLQEIHHRVKNNLQVVTSLLNLHASRSGNKEVAENLRDSQNRIRAMALIHERLYQSRNLSMVDFNDYIRTISGELVYSYCLNPGRIRLDIDVEKVMLEINKAIPCGLIINEVITNALKYAFPEGETEEGIIQIAMHKENGGMVHLRISDNGIGLPDETCYETNKTLGFMLINLLTMDQLKGTVDISGEDGTTVAVQFPVGSSDSV
ncbi:MAG TPA: histidine kinase dimerization/phosphoacceptor domain -containing protein [Spirochaetota bacterium]|nr:histidine kinase dimerization/phosphoacceptor domain -containing protein [Spirochaetota bacterium]